MAAYRYIEANGLIMPDTAALREEVAGEYRAALGADLVTNPETPEGLLITAETLARDTVVRNNAALANQINPNMAGGVFLDAIAALTGVERRPAESTLTLCQLGGVPDTLIPAGARAKTEAGDIFVSRKAVVLGDDGKAEMYFSAQSPGPVPCPAGSLTTIVDQALGWESVNNENSGVLGQALENDSLFRRRRRRTLYKQGVALPGAIQSALYDTPGVRSLAYRENYTSAPQVIDGKELAPHSIYVCVDGGTDEDVAKAIFDNKSLGCGYNGATTATVLEPVSGQRYAVTFDRPEIVQVRAVVTVRNTDTAVSDVQALVRAAIVAYADNDLWSLLADNGDALKKAEALPGFEVGTAVSPFELSAAVACVAPSLFVLRVEVGLIDSAETSPDLLPIEIWQKAQITEGAIQVVSA